MYRRCGGALQQRLAQLLAQGVVATPIAPDGLSSAALGPAGSPWSAATKQEAIRRYTNQLRAVDIVAPTDTDLPERLWDLVDQKPGIVYETTVRPPCADEDIGELIELHRAYVATGMGIVAAHELSQPLSAIANYAEAGLRRLEQEHVTLEDLAEDLTKIKTQIRRAAELMRHLRSLVDRNTGQVRHEDLNELVRSACDSFSRATRYRHIQVVLQLAEDLPLVAAQRLRTQHALANLLQNASDAILVSGRTAGLITVTTARAVNKTGCGGCVTVRDNGIGIMPDSAARFFEPFFTTKDGGLGMGLTVSRALVQAQGGRLWLEPAEGAGIVHFTLPSAS
jgi:signal transduction histidine kinase